MRLTPNITPSFERDFKRLERRHVDTSGLFEAISLIIENTDEARATLRTRHRMHPLHGEWRGFLECHVGNRGDWLLIWRVEGDMAVLARTGTHEELFR